jgi:hypothetical protein
MGAWPSTRMLDGRATMERLAAFYKVEVVTTLEYE